MTFETFKIRGAKDRTFCTQKKWYCLFHPGANLTWQLGAPESLPKPIKELLSDLAIKTQKL